MYANQFGDPTTRVAAAFGAVDKILSGAPRGAGVFLLGHSAGCELALRMAVADRGGVIGLELAGTGLRYRDEALAIIKDATVTSRPVGLRDLLWQPTALYPPEVLTGALSAPGVRYEGEVTANWTGQDFGKLAAQVSVPVQFSVADHEKVWESTPDACAAVMALFTASPRVELNEMPDSGHNLSVGLTAATYHRRVLTYAEECIAAAGSDAENREVEAG